MKDKIQLENFGSLITVKGTDTCLGDLMNFPGHGVFDPNHGRVDVPPQHAGAHNQALDNARLKGMDENCQVGQTGYAYWSGNCVKSFLGTVISYAVKRVGQTVTFHRGLKVFRGRLPKDGEAFNFRRVA